MAASKFNMNLFFIIFPFSKNLDVRVNRNPKHVWSSVSF